MIGLTYRIEGKERVIPPGGKVWWWWSWPSSWKQNQIVRMMMIDWTWTIDDYDCLNIDDDDCLNVRMMMIAYSSLNVGDDDSLNIFIFYWFFLFVFFFPGLAMTSLNSPGRLQRSSRTSSMDRTIAGHAFQGRGKNGTSLNSRLAFLSCNTINFCHTFLCFLITNTFLICYFVEKTHMGSSHYR